MRFWGTRMAALLAALAVLPACGTRVAHIDVVSAAGTQRLLHGTADAAGGTEVSSTDANTSGAGAEAVPTEGPAANAASAVAQHRSTRTEAQRQPGATPGVAGPTSSKSVVKIASIGTYSGPIGNAIRPLAEGAQVWTRWINDRGGVNGHHVSLTVADDGADPARYRAQVRDLVERQHIIAFVQNGDGINGPTMVRYLTEHRVPVIGGDTGGQYFYESPMYFPQASSGRNLAAAQMGSIAQRALARGKRKFGSISCQEAQTCAELQRLWSENARQLGLQPVYEAKSSLVQPDYTAECLNASRAGAEIIMFGMDANSIGRIAGSCARQSYRPIFAWGASIASSTQASDPNLDGALVVLGVFPWTVNDTPATREFHEAFDTYGRGLKIGGGHSSGWVSGKIFEKATAALPEPPTSQAVLEGLWSLKNETLGGIAAPLTYVREKNAPQTRCWYNMTISHRAFSAPNGAQYFCR